MYYSNNESTGFNPSIWGTDNSFFPRVSERVTKETEDLLKELDNLGKYSSEDAKSDDFRSENTGNQNLGTSGNNTQEMSPSTGNQAQDFSIMGSGNLGTYPANQNMPFMGTAPGAQNFNTSTNPLYGTYYFPENAASSGFSQEGISPSNPMAQGFIGAAMHPSMYGWTHYCIPHMPAYPIPTNITPYPQGFMGPMGPMGGGANQPFPMMNYPNANSTGAYPQVGFPGNPMNAPMTPMGMNSMAIFPFTPFTGAPGTITAQRDDDMFEDYEDNMYLEPSYRGSKRRPSRKKKKHKGNCFYYNSLSNYPYYSPVSFPMHQQAPEGCNCFWLYPFLLDLDRY